MMDQALLTRCALGLDVAHLDPRPAGPALTTAAGAAWQRLVDRAARAGFELTPASSWRDYARQLNIFNGKAEGHRMVHDDLGAPLARGDHNDWQWVQCILRFSALPGTSRHHWGTDLDVYDRSALPDGYQLQLTPDEYAPGGVLAALNEWLDDLITADDAEGFFRPYAADSGGVAPEPWHLSYRPGAEGFAGLLSRESIWNGELPALWQAMPALAMSDVVMAHLAEIRVRYVVLS